MRNLTGLPQLVLSLLVPFKAFCSNKDKKISEIKLVTATYEAGRNLGGISARELHVFFIRNWFIRNEYYTGRKIKKL